MTASLFVRMLRWRVAVTLWSFLLIGAAAQGPLRPGLALVLAAIALCASYVVATTVNDIADRDVDRINHPRDHGRPLVDGTATERDLWRTNAIAVPIALAAAAAAGGPVLGVTIASLALGYAYSLGPARLSYRTWLAPAVLGLAYAVAPYSLGMLAVGGRFDAVDALLCAALYALFLGRIVLKDFRDRAGDAAFGKPTLLLRHGKAVTCGVTAVATVVGCGTLIVGLSSGLGVVVAIAALGAGVLWMLRTLWRTSDPRGEQLAIGLGAKLGNGMLACALATLVLRADAAPEGIVAVVVAFLVVLYGTIVVKLAARPDEIRIAYKG